MLSFFTRYTTHIILLIGFITAGSTKAQEGGKDSNVGSHFITLATSGDKELIEKSLNSLERNWDESYEIMLIETLYFSLNREVAADYLSLLESKARKNFGYDMNKWFKWLWSKPAVYGPEYFEFKASLHEFIDPRFRAYFSQRQQRSTIRLDEVVWGGVIQDGIPPLRNPKMINAAEATYLKDTDVVFGIEINGDIRAYPKRILAWHELFTDVVGGIPVAGVYCTLCGTVILYETHKDGIAYQLGTSGFLYRSNKLMYDKETQSLWSTLEGKPVIGPLVNKGIVLDYQSVVTTTWGQWKSRHPQTKVLSLETGHSRDYREGIAYQEYFATDDLMFQVPETDARLKNKDVILAIRIPELTEKSMAISSQYLRSHIVYSNELEGVQFTVFTDKSGAHRVYNTRGLIFKEYDGASTATDLNGIRWKLEENQLVSPGKEELDRLHSYNAFWFGFRAAFPDTTLIY